MVKYQSFSVTFYPCCFSLVLFLNSFGSYTLLTNYNTCISITTCFVTCDLPKSPFAHRPLVVVYTLCIIIVQRLATRQFTICCLSTYFSAFLRYEACRFVLQQFLSIIQTFFFQVIWPYLVHLETFVSRKTFKNQQKNKL